MKVLIILPSFPYPPDSGFRIKAFNLIEILSKRFDVDLMILQLKKETVDDTYYQGKDIKCKSFYISSIEKIINILRAAFSKIPFQSAVYRSKNARRFISANVNRYDYVVCSMIRTCDYIDLIPKSKVIIDMVDLLSKSYTKSKENTNSIFFKIVYQLEVGRLARMEKYVAENASHVLLVNKDEAEFLNIFSNNVKWIPNGVNNLLFEYSKINQQYENDVVFIGTMNYQPNIDAIVWLDQYVLDHIDPNIRVVIIGKNPVKSIRDIQKRRKNIIITGYLDDPYDIVNSGLAVLAPMQNGGGIQNKLLESMALGTINIVTSYAAQPIFGAKDAKHFLVKDDPLEFASLINTVYSDREKFFFLKENSKEFIKNNYKWDLYEDKLIALLQK